MINFCEILRLHSLEYTQHNIAASVYGVHNTIINTIKRTEVGTK